MGHRRLTKKIVREALINKKGAVYLAASDLGCSHTAIYDYLDKYPELQELKDGFDEEVTDIAVLNLRKAVINADPWALKYQLSTKGKNRGYIERQEITGKDGEPQKVEVEYINSPIKHPELSPGSIRDKE